MSRSSSSSITTALLWILAATVTGYLLHGVGVLPSNVPITTTIGLLVFGGLLYYLSAAFVAYYSRDGTRLT